MNDCPELFLFAQDDKEWRFTNADRDITEGGELFASVPIGRDDFESSRDITKANLPVFLDRRNPLAQEFLAYVGDAITSVTVWKWDPDTNGFVVEWKGRVSTDTIEGNEVTLECESVFTSLRRPGLRARFQKTCRHALYDGGCKADREQFAVEAPWQEYNGSLLRVDAAAGYSSGWFSAGMVKAPDGTLRFILNHSGNLLSLSRPIETLAEVSDGYGNNYGGFYGSSTVTLYPGCTKSRAVCKNKFGNLNNYGGFPWVPTKNPFGGSSIV